MRQATPNPTPKLPKAGGRELWVHVRMVNLLLSRGFQRTCKEGQFGIKMKTTGEDAATKNNFFRISLLESF